MIVKSYEISEKKLDQHNFILVYGDNEGLKQEIIDKLKNSFNNTNIYYDEAQVLSNINDFFNNVLNQSLFEKEKTLIINRCSEKILDVMSQILEKKTSEVKIILNAGLLETRSKLRITYEKNKDLVIIPTYKDTSQTLIGITRKFFNNYKISLSQETINLLVNRCNGNRGHLKSELNKILLYIHEKRTISTEEIYKLTNLSENYSINELVNNSLSKNIKKTSEILSESNYRTEDAILILRVFLQKAKKLMELLEKLDNKKNIDSLINSSRPPIFWKDKPVVKKQLEMWSLKKIRELIDKINQTELNFKKNNQSGLLFVFDFIFEVSSNNSNNVF
tara:strand:- start:428 stop:1429 length:1002 start_codon:yes stop_codon:yes gene_type:complete